MTAREGRARARAQDRKEREREERAARRRSAAPMPAWLAPPIAALGGYAAWTAFPPHDLWYLLPLGLAALTATCLVRRPGIAALSGLAWGMAFFLPLTAWANIYAGLEPWIALAVFESLYIVGFALAARAVLVRWGPSPRAGLVVACLWTGIEALRSHVPWGGLPWGASAFALQDSPLLTLGPWIGTAGLAVVVGVLSQLLLGAAWLLLGRRAGRSRSLGLWPLTAAIVVVLACLVVPRPHNPAPDGSGTLRIAGIQGNVPRLDPQDLEMPAEIWDNSLALTEQAGADARSAGTDLDLVVWPEASAGWDPRQDAVRSRALVGAAEDAGAPVLIGTATEAPGDRVYNTSQLWTLSGGPEQSYSKRHPVPFGEYIPARSIFRMLSDKVDLVPTDMAPGRSVGVLDVGERKVGVLICFEIAYENLVQDVVRDDAEVIVVQTNTALFGDSDEAAQQLGEARVLSAISGRSIVQVATVGESAIVTPDGRDLARTGHWEQGIVVADVPLRTGITPAMAAGPWIAVGIGALGLAGLLLALGSPRRAVDIPAPRRVRRTR